MSARVGTNTCGLDGVHSDTLTPIATPSPTDRLQAIVSTQHWAAAVLLHGAAGLAQGADAMVHHPAVVALRRCVRLALADAIALPEVRAAVTRRDGRRIEVHV